MWYGAEKYVLAGVYETVSATPLEWLGNFTNTFKEFSPWGQRPDPDQLPAFIQRYVVPQLEKYSHMEGSDFPADDINAFVNFASQFIDYYLKQDRIPRATYVLLDAEGLASRVRQKAGLSSINVVNYSYSSGNTSYAQNILNLNYGYLTAMLKSGLTVSPEFLYYIVSGNDLKDNPTRGGTARDGFIQYVLQSFPYTELYLPQNKQKLLDILKNPESIKNEQLKSMFQQSGIDATFMRGPIQTYLVNAVTRSGANAEESLPVLINWVENPESSDLGYSEVMVYTPEQLVQMLNKLENTSDDKAIKKTISGVRTRFDDLKENEVKKIRKLPKTMAAINNVDKSSIFEYNRERIEAGLADADETIEYLENHPERVGKIAFTEHIPTEVLEKHKIIHEEKQAKIATDVRTAFTEAINSGMIVKQNASSDPMVMDFLLTEGTKNAGLKEEDIRGYAQYLTIYRFNRYEIVPFLKQTGGVIVNGVDFGGAWSGLFIPRFSDPSDGTLKPAIFIRKDAWNTTEYLKALAENLKMSLSSFTEAVTKHEGSHALHYLGAGDSMMGSPVLEQTLERAMRKRILEDESLTEEQKTEMLPPKRWESDEILYLTDPAEIYARAHGDIPHLVEVFKERIEALKDNPLVAKAVENQWVEDVVGTMAGIASGGTSPAFLQRDLAEGRGWLASHPDPIEAMNKILERQEAKLRNAYQEDILQDRRAEMLKIIKQINVQKNIAAKAETEGDYSAKIDAESMVRKLNKELELVKYRKVFNVDGISDLILAGYLRDYMQKLTDAVGAGHITTDRIISDETNDAIKERLQQLKTIPAEDKVEQPTTMDIRDLTEDLVKQSRPIPGGRMFDMLSHLPAPEYARSGFYPHKEQKPENEQQVQASAVRWYIRS